ncbi:hypothetical protein CRG98_010011 [Punica granatum]|uniref:Uncharacterized protein n=1 Tax=Punica granatum TaxID=22663 RepID=A0A2I0KM91_PUNGR|nr:hypothetical protein CRG98_010011 [Punica granatum]
MGPSRVGLDHRWVRFGLFWLEQTRMVAKDPTGRVDRPDWHKSDILKWKTNASCLEGRSQGTWTAMGMGEVAMSWPWVPRVVRQREQLSLKPIMQTWSRRCPRRSKLDFSDCFLSFLGTPEITMISVCRDWISKDLKSVHETSKALLGRFR